MHEPQGRPDVLEMNSYLMHLLIVIQNINWRCHLVQFTREVSYCLLSHFLVRQSIHLF